MFAERWSIFCMLCNYLAILCDSRRRKMSTPTCATCSATYLMRWDDLKTKLRQPLRTQPPRCVLWSQVYMHSAFCAARLLTQCRRVRRPNLLKRLRFLPIRNACCRLVVIMLCLSSCTCACVCVPAKKSTFYLHPSLGTWIHIWTHAATSQPQALHDGRRQDRLLNRTQRLLRDASSIMRRCERSCGIGPDM